MVRFWPTRDRLLGVDRKSPSVLTPGQFAFSQIRCFRRNGTTRRSDVGESRRRPAQECGTVQRREPCTSLFAHRVRPSRRRDADVRLRRLDRRPRPARHLRRAPLLRPVRRALRAADRAARLGSRPARRRLRPLRAPAATTSKLSPTPCARRPVRRGATRRAVPADAVGGPDGRDPTRWRSRAAAICGCCARPSHSTGARRPALRGCVGHVVPCRSPCRHMPFHAAPPVPLHAYGSAWSLPAIALPEGRFGTSVTCREPRSSRSVLARG